MSYTYSTTIHLPRELVWKYIRDEDILRKTLPGCKSFNKVGEELYHAELGLSVGPVKGLFTSEVKQVNQQPPASYRLIIDGKGKPGEIHAVADMVLEELSPNSTKLTCIAEVQVTSVLASLGKKVMGGVAKVILGQFFKNAEKEMRKQEANI